ncbi:hypothetical protein P7C70_g6213, partial [Phenoliferia sp. Uapishka_3]
MRRKLVADVDKFQATPRVGYRIPDGTTKEEDEEPDEELGASGGGSSHSGVRGESGVSTSGQAGGHGYADEPNANEFGFENVEGFDGGGGVQTGEQSNARADSLAGDRMPSPQEDLGGHDEFTFDDTGFTGEDIEMLESSPKKLPGSASLTTRSKGSDDDSDSNDSDDSDEYDSRRSDAGHKASEHRRDYNNNFEDTYDEVELERNEMWGFDELQIGGEDEAAAANHHRPESRAASNDDYSEETPEEYHERLLGQGAAMDPFAPVNPVVQARDGADGEEEAEEQDEEEDRDLPFQRVPEADEEEIWPDIDGPDDGPPEAFANADSDDDVEIPEVSPEPEYGAPDIATAPRAVKANPGEYVPVPNTSARSRRFNRTGPPVPCEPPTRQLGREDMLKILFYEMAVDHAIGPLLMERLKWVMDQAGVPVDGLESLYKLRVAAFDLSGLEISYGDQCSGHISSSNPKTKDWVTCPEVIERVGLPSIICGRSRYLPLNTPNLTSLRKNSQKLGQELPPRNKVPRDQHSHCHIGPFVDAIYANPEQSADLLRANRASIKAAVEDSSRIDGFETGEMARRFFDPESGVCNKYDMLLSTTSDGADIYPLATPTHAVHAQLAGVRIPALKAMKHSFLYVAGVNGPVKGSTTLYLHDISADLDALEKPKVRYVAALGAMAETRGFAALNTSDTVEQCILSGTVGAAGKCLSMSHWVRGVWNLGLGRWHHPLLSFRCAAEDEELRDLRPDVWTHFSPLPIPGQLGKTFIPRVRHIKHYDKVINQLEDPTISQARKKEITTASGITGRSIYDSLGIFRWSYPWMFSLDDMHVTYSNNMKHFLEAIFGKDAEKPVLRGVMINPVQHARMAAALARTIHLQPSAHGQKVRGITHIGRLKAAELRSFLWFHLASLFHGVAETPKDMELVVSAIRSTRVTTNRVILRDAPYDPDFCTYDFDDQGEFPIPYANVRHAIDDHLIKRERHFVGRQYEFGATCVASVIRSHALPDMARKWGAGLLATSQWGLEGKIGDIKRHIKSRTLPVKNMENINVDLNILTLVHLKYDLPVFHGPVKENLRKIHPRILDTTFLHTKKENSFLSALESKALWALLKRNGGLRVGTKQPTRWQRVKLTNGETIGSIGREYGTELGRIVVEEDNEDDDDVMQKEREGIRRATQPLPRDELKALNDLHQCWLDAVHWWQEGAGQGIARAAINFTIITDNLVRRADRRFYTDDTEYRQTRTAYVRDSLYTSSINDSPCRFPPDPTATVRPQPSPELASPSSPRATNDCEVLAHRSDFGLEQEGRSLQQGHSQAGSQASELRPSPLPRSATPYHFRHSPPSSSPVSIDHAPSSPKNGWAGFKYIEPSPDTAAQRAREDQIYLHRQLELRAAAQAEGRTHIEFSDEEEPDTSPAQARWVLPRRKRQSRRSGHHDFNTPSSSSASSTSTSSPTRLRDLEVVEDTSNSSQPTIIPSSHPSFLASAPSSEPEPDTETDGSLDEVDQDGKARDPEEVCLRTAHRAWCREGNRLLLGHSGPPTGYAAEWAVRTAAELARRRSDGLGTTT